MVEDTAAAVPSRLFGWWRSASADARRALAAASFGWMLDAFDVMLYAMVLASLMGGLNMGKGTAGLLGSLTLVASAFGGLIFGMAADRYGRRRALMASVLLYSVFTAACGLASSVAMLAVFRALLGLGMGGEWASGAALVSETWPARDRGKALGFVQSSWAIGYAGAAAVAALVLPAWGWRAVFFVGVLPAFFTLWVQRRVREPEIWRESRRAAAEGRSAGAGAAQVRFGDLFRRPFLGTTLLVTLMNAFTLFAWWGLNLWIPAYLSLAAKQGGRGLGARGASGLVLFMQVGMWLGYVTFGYFADRFGRKRSYMAFLLAAAAAILVYGSARTPLALLLLGPVVAFFGTGYFSGFGALTAELYPTSIRATAQGFTYNAGRVVSAAAPFVVGSLAATKGFGAAFPLLSVSFLAAAVLWIWIPETRGRELQ